MKFISKFTVTVAILLGFALGRSTAQQLPADPQIRTGVLENGLTYYIRHNEMPKQRADFYIAQKVGSMQEEEDQRGLAHFLEHMAFNGTTNFPEKEMLQYLESIGAKFGTNVNAYTSFDETVYQLMDVPVVREGIVDSCLLVLYDWSCGIALEGDEIDAERGVIHEEWRTRQTAVMRMWDRLIPKMLPESKYAHRMPIGTMDVVLNFDHQTLRDYYHRWYRPDLQAIIVVGDIDVDEMERKIRERFEDIAMPDPVVPRIYYDVPDNSEPIVAVATDREATTIQLAIYYKHDPIPEEYRNTVSYYVMSFMNNVISTMFDNRVAELTNQPNPPFLGAAVYYGSILGVTKTKEAFTAVAISGEDNMERSILTLVEELKRIDLYGFTASEYERAKADFLSSIENLYKERDKAPNRRLTGELVRAFVDKEPTPGIEFEYELYAQLVPMIPVEQINAYVQSLITDENVIIVLQGPEKDGFSLPTEEELLAMYRAGKNAEVEAYEDTVSDEPLIGELPAKGAIVAEKHDDIFDATVWTLSNGATVVIKPTENRDDQIMMTAVSPGGSSLIGSDFDTEVLFLSDAADVGGLGNFSTTDLAKVLAGKKVSLGARISEMSERIAGTSTPKDLETFLQLNYLQFTDVRRDQDAFDSWQTRNVMQLRNLAANPMLAFQDSIYATMYNHDPRIKIPSVEDIEKVDYDKVMALYKERFADASDFIFIFVGNIDAETLRPLAEQYIATLPSTHSQEEPGKLSELQKGHINNYFEKTIEQPKVAANIVVSGHFEPTLANVAKFDMFSQILRSRYTDTMREEEGGTYSPQVRMTNVPRKQFGWLTIMYDTNADQYETLAAIALREIEKLASEGPAEADFRKVKEYMLKKHVEDLQNNGFWLDKVEDFYLLGLDYMTGYEETVSAITPEDLREFIRAFVDQGNIIEVTMNGVAAE